MRRLDQLHDRFRPQEPLTIVIDGRAQVILSRMGEPEDVVFGDQTTAMMWSPDIVSFLRGAGTDRELGIRDAAAALNMTLRVWLARSASNDPHGPA